MNEEHFRRQLEEGGYEEIQLKEYAPDTDGEMHSHDFSVRLLVLDGAFTLARRDGDTTFSPGEVCELDAGVAHVERTGAGGARVLLGKRRA